MHRTRCKLPDGALSALRRTGSGKLASSAVNTGTCDSSAPPGTCLARYIACSGKLAGRAHLAAVTSARGELSGSATCARVGDGCAKLACAACDALVVCTRCEEPCGTLVALVSTSWCRSTWVARSAKYLSRLAGEVTLRTRLACSGACFVLMLASDARGAARSAASGREVTGGTHVTYSIARDVLVLAWGAVEAACLTDPHAIAGSRTVFALRAILPLTWRARAACRCACGRRLSHGTITARSA